MYTSFGDAFYANMLFFVVGQTLGEGMVEDMKIDNFDMYLFFKEGVAEICWVGIFMEKLLEEG